MEKPPIIEEALSTHYSARNHAIVAIIAHASGHPRDQSLNQVLRYLHKNERRVSYSIFVTKTGKILQLVKDEYAAHHAGYGTLRLNGKVYSRDTINVNRATLGISMENHQDGRDCYTDIQLLNYGYVINLWRAKHGHLPIFRHNDIDPTRRFDTLNLSVEMIEHWCERAKATYG